MSRKRKDEAFNFRENLECSKTIFPSLRRATAALKSLRSNDSIRIYYCRTCKGYHFTNILKDIRGRSAEMSLDAKSRKRISEKRKKGRSKRMRIQIRKRK